MLLFRLSNYFLRFSEEYKRQHPNEPFTNDWHEFVEYGTTNKLRIILQRSGYKRESTEYIRRNADKYVRDPESDILNCIKTYYRIVRMKFRAASVSEAGI